LITSLSCKPQSIIKTFIGEVRIVEVLALALFLQETLATLAASTATNFLLLLTALQSQSEINR